MIGATPFCASSRTASSTCIASPFYVEMAVRHSIYGRPGGAYLDIADDIIQGKCDEGQVVVAAKCPEPPRSMAMPQ